MWISPKPTIYYAFVQEQWPPVLKYSKLKKKNTKRSSYIILIREILLLKTAWVCLGTYTRQHGTSTEHFRGKSVWVFSPSLPYQDILIVNALKQRVKHSQRQSEVNKNTFYTFTSTRSEEILKIANVTHSRREYILSVSWADRTQAVGFVFFSFFSFCLSKNNFFLKTSLQILLQWCQNSYH